MSRIFQVADDQEIKEGRVTDVYFERTVQVLQAKGIRKQVAAEVRTTTLPAGYQWAVLAGVEELARMMEGIPATLWTMPEGTFFQAGEPVALISGEYAGFAVYETPLLGLLCQASGVATKASRCKLAAGDRSVISFGARRMHPALAPMIERNAFIGGCDGVAVIKSAELIGEQAMGTMPHALVLAIGSAREAFRDFNQVVPQQVLRVCLVDTFGDEKFESLAAAEELGQALYGVRLDTPGSRRGDMLRIAQEVRWELDLRGYQHVKIFVSGGLEEEEIVRLNPACDAYGVGTSISNAPVINLAMDIVEVEGKPLAKRGKESGRKQVYRCDRCPHRQVVPWEERPDLCHCGGNLVPLLEPLIEDGRLARRLPPPRAIRQGVLDQLRSGYWRLE